MPLLLKPTTIATERYTVKISPLAPRNICLMHSAFLLMLRLLNVVTRLGPRALRSRLKSLDLSDTYRVSRR